MRTTLLLLGLAASAAGQISTPFADPNPIVFHLEADSPISQDGQDTRDVTWVDFDRDGDMDLFVVNFAQNNILYRNEGGGGFEVVSDFVLNTDDGNSYGAAWGDMDADGDPDVAIANGDGQDNYVYRNMGYAQAGTTGRFVKLVGDPATSDGGESFAVAWADFDGDGDQDLVFANKWEPNALYWNDGTGAFTREEASPVVTENRRSRDVAVGDLDGDGDPDLVFANSNAQQNRIWLNQGGTFVASEGHDGASQPGDTYGVSLADFDGDGDLDLFAANRLDEFNAFYEGAGDGSFAHRPDLVPSQDRGDSYEGAWGDIDADGDLDLLVANRDQTSFLYLNDRAAGAFVRVLEGDAVSLSAPSYAAAFVDSEGNGFESFVLANSLGTSNQMLRNRGPQWRDLGHALPGAATTPRLFVSGTLAGGTTLRLGVTRAPESTPAYLVVGAEDVSLPFMGGVLVPAPQLVLAGPATNAQGELDLAGKVPAGVPSAQRLHFQFWFPEGPGPRDWAATNALAGWTP